MTDISTTEQWTAVEDLVPSIGEVSLRELFADDPERGRRMSITAASTRSLPGIRSDGA